MVNAWHLGVTAIVFTCFGTVLAVARLYTRGVVLRAFKWDDLFLTLALLSGIGGFGVVVLMAFRDLEGMPEDKNGRKIGSPFYWEFAIFNEVAIAIYTLQNMFSRLSLLISFQNITPKDSRRSQHVIINTVAIVALLTGIAFTFVELFPCWPIHMMTYPDTWQSHGKYYCLAPRQVFWWSGFVGVIINFAVYALPFWLVHTIKITRQQRYGMYSLFAFGGLVFVVSIVRLPFLVVLKKNPLFSVDLYRLMLMWLLTVVEANMLLCAASIPTLRPLWRRMHGQDPSPLLSAQKASIGRESTPSPA